MYGGLWRGGSACVVWVLKIGDSDRLKKSDQMLQIDGIWAAME